MAELDSTQQDTGKSRRDLNATRQAEKPAKAEPTQHFDIEPRVYDLDVIEDFLNLVFHSELTTDEETMMWVVPRHRKPVYPISENEMFDHLEGSKVPRALYFGTATARRDHTGGLFNRQALFERLHVVVLDDIGTKGQAADLPEDLKPTYIVESSEGNFQYGYVLETPIDNLDSAKALVSIMYEAGIADAGGKMPNKLVRLPEGVNGKKGDKCDFVTALISKDGPLWTPQGLLDALNCGGSWEEIQADALDATKRRTRLRGGTTPWAPYRPTRASMSGIIDPVAEWLEENDKIVSESDEWLTVRCPFSDGHTSGGDTAGYKPVGVGEDPNLRLFHCFHDSCSEMKTREFLQYVATLEGPNVSAKDDVAEMVSAYAYDTINDCAWKIKNSANPQQISMSGMRNTHPRQNLVALPDGKLKAVSEFSRWLTSESRVTVMGVTFSPSNPARIVEAMNGDLLINQYAPPAWGSGGFDDTEVEVFKQFLEYLIPDKFEREYFTDWLAAKVQDMGFRGAAIVMVAQRQGIGRSTLADMIGTLLGEVNTRNEPFEKVVGETQYNDWLEAPFVVSDETLNTGGLNSYKTYEKLKELIDPRPKMVTINPKYGKQRRTMVHSSFLFLSNHSNALSMSEDDRRFFVISNPHVPESGEYFIKLNDWLDRTDPNGQPTWAPHVYRWLLERKVDMAALLAPPVSTTGKAAMIEESRSDIDAVSKEIFAKWPCEYISANEFTQALERFAERLDLYDVNNYKAQIKRIFASATYPLDPKSNVKVAGKSVRYRVIVSRAGADTAEKGEILEAVDKTFIRGVLIPENISEAIKNVGDALDVLGI
jgi:hypothetical protein